MGKHRRFQMGRFGFNKRKLISADDLQGFEKWRIPGLGGGRF